MSKRTKWDAMTDDDKRALVEAYEGGESARSCSRRCGVAYQTITKWLRWLGVEIRDYRQAALADHNARRHRRSQRPAKKKHSADGAIIAPVEILDRPPLSLDDGRMWM